MTKPYYQDDSVTVYCGDCRDILPELPPVDVAIVDPPYGETELDWDVPVVDWLGILPCLNAWCFGSLRYFMGNQPMFQGWTLAQDIVWEKHNGSMFHADRFRRVHEHVVQFYRGRWVDIYKQPVTTPDAVRRTIHRKTRPAHSGRIDASTFVSYEAGPRLQRSVIRVKSTHGYGQHPTQKPVGIVVPLLEYSCPPGGTVVAPFFGSGTTGVAAKMLGRKCIGIEIEERYCEIAANRCRQQVLDMRC